MHGEVHGSIVQSGSMRDLHVHSSVPIRHRDPRLVLLGVVALMAGLGMTAAFLLLSGWTLLTAMNFGLSFLGSANGLPLPSGGLVALVLLVGFLAFNLLWTAWDLMGRRHHAWRLDAFAGQSSLWLSLLAPALVVGDEFWAAVVLVGVMAGATVAAVALTCRRGTRLRWGLVVTAGVAAALWFGPVLWLLWVSRSPLPGQLAATAVLVVAMAVPVLAVTLMPAACGGVVLRGWALGVVLACGLGYAAAEALLSSSLNLSVPVLVVPASAVVVALVLSGVLGSIAKRAAAGS
ncbi:hypothetical protein ACH413_07830 [Lentzea sp. NPDC020367]